ncbi:hypothetical protein VRB53_10430 [Pseudomonas trivialis]|uniref:hypothetical protein n=1 Tax=Pseudomonas trivialis TaxID=200450 RepID=UPI0030D1D676
MLISNTGFSNTYPADEHRFPDIQRHGGMLASPSRVTRSTTSGAPPAAQLATSLEASDQQLAANYIQALSSALWTNQSDYLDTELGNIPAKSTFGKWWQQYRDAMNNPNFVHWIKARGLDVSSILLEPHSGFLSAFFNGKKNSFGPKRMLDGKRFRAPSSVWRKYSCLHAAARAWFWDRRLTALLLKSLGIFMVNPTPRIRPGNRLGQEPSR